jgi:hypothetical protein
VYGDTYAKTGELSPWTSLLAGTAAAALDTVLPARILSKVGGPVANDIVVDKLVKRLGKEGAATFLLEGGTEALQTIIEQLPSGEVDWDEVIEAGLRGGFGGGVAGSAVAGYQAASEARAAPTAPPAPSTGVPEGSAPISVPVKTGPATKSYKAAMENTRVEIQDRVQTLTGGWENSAEVEVHPNFKKLKGVANDAVGVYANGRLQLNTEAIIKEAKERDMTVDQMVEAVTFHEGLGHHGLAVEFGVALDDKLATILDNSTVYQSRVSKWLEKNPEAYAGDPNRDLRALEEIMAERSEKVGSKALPTGFVNTMKNTVKDFGRRMGLDLQYGTREVETILGMAHQAVKSGKGRDVRSNGFRFMMTGAKSRTAPYYMRAAASMAASEGQDVGPNSQVRKDLGWFKGPDDKWRFEMDDSRSGIHYLTREDLEEEHDDSGDTPWFMTNQWEHSSALDALASGQENLEELPLHKVLEHPELFKAYPELKNIRVSSKYVEDNFPDVVASNLGFFDPSSGYIYVSSKLNHDEVHSVLLRSPQGKREVRDDPKLKQYGPDILSRAVKELLDEGNIKALKEYFASDKKAGYEAYTHIFGEVEARDTQLRRNMTPEERRETAPYQGEPEVDPESLIVFNDAEQPSHRYMMMSKPENVKFTPEEIAEMTPEELLDSRNVMNVLDQMTEGYEPIIMSLDDL